MNHIRVVPNYRAIQNTVFTGVGELKRFCEGTEYVIEEEFWDDNNPWLVKLNQDSRDDMLGRIDFDYWLVYNPVSEEMRLMSPSDFHSDYRVTQ